MAAPSIVVQTTYAELLERCAAAAFVSPFQRMEPLLRKRLKDVATGTFKRRLRKAARNDMLGRNLPNCSSGSRSISKREMMNASAEHWYRRWCDL